MKSTQQREETGVSYRIDRDELTTFVNRQVELVEALPVERQLAAGGEYEPEAMDPATLEAVWLAAAIAAFIGQAICDEPERFIREHTTVHAA